MSDEHRMRPSRWKELILDEIADAAHIGWSNWERQIDPTGDKGFIREHLRNWLDGLYASALSLEGTEGRDTVIADYWHRRGEHPADDEKLRDAILAALRAAGIPPNHYLFEWLRGFPARDRSTEAEDLAMMGVLLLRLDDWIEDAEDSANRVLELLDLLLDVSLPKPAMQYLSRIGQLWAAGFDVEAVALSRSVLDVAMADRVPDRMVHELLGSAGRGYLDLNQRIKAARQLELLSAEGERAANLIRIRGNALLHLSPEPGGADMDPRRALGLLRLVLRELYTMNRPGFRAGSHL